MADGREVGVFTGHTEGLTYVDSKGDGRYVLSNAKDQTMKLWDIRLVILGNLSVVVSGLSLMRV